MARSITYVTNVAAFGWTGAVFIYFQEPPKDIIEYIPCVRCGKLMNRKNFAKISGVILDECGKHGVWLDAGELEKIRHFIMGGGLEKAQDIEAEKLCAE